MNEPSRGNRRRRRQTLILAAAITGSPCRQHAVAVAVARPAAHTSAYIYWADSTATIGRANLNGTDVNERFITGAKDPNRAAVNSHYICWASDPAPARGHKV